eukprot:jgi/Orpsp1_1/1190992/evm.model.d7180000082728.1
MVKYLIEHGAYVDKEGKYYSHHYFCNIYKSPLMFAVSNNDLTIAKYLVEHGANVNKEAKNDKLVNDERVDTSLTLAVKNKNMSMIKYLVEEAGADVNLNTPVKLSIYSNNLKITKYLVEKGANFYFNDYHETPLINTFYNGNSKMAKYLIDIGINVNEKQRPHYESALMEAIKLRKISVAKYLIEHNSNLDCGNFFSETALSRAVFSNNFLFLKYLIENGAYVNECYYNRIESIVDNTPINEAIIAGNTNFVRYLIKHGADIFYEPKKEMCSSYRIESPEKTNEENNFNEHNYPVYLEIKKALDEVKNKLYN